MTILSALRALGRDRRGVVAPMVAIMGTALVGSAGLALDVGLYYVDSNALKAATEAAALSAAGSQDITTATATANARAYLASNGFDPSVLQSVTVGCYSADGRMGSDGKPIVQSTSRFAACAAGSIRNTALRITTKKDSRQYLSRVLGSANPIPAATATATAARIDEAGVGITTGVLTVNNGLVTSVNDLLGAWLGMNLNLSSPQIGSLMSSNIDAGKFFDALAARVGEQGTYSDLTSRTVQLSDILAAASTTAAADNNAAAAATFTSLAGQVGTGYSVPLTGLFGLGVWSKMPVGGADTHPGLRAGLNAYQLLAFAVQGGGGKIDLSDAVSVAVPGSTVKLAGVATGPLSRPRFAFGPEGSTSVGTSAVRIQLQLGVGPISVPLLSILPISVTSVPVLIDIAAGTADIKSSSSSPAIRCGSDAAADTSVQVYANSGLLNAYIGTAPASAMTSPMPVISASDITATRIVNALGLVTVDARAVAQPVFGASRYLTFGPGGDGTVGRPPSAGNAASIGNTSQAGPLLNSLTTSITATGGLDVRLLKFCLPLVCSDSIVLGSVRSQLLSSITGSLSGLVGSTADPVIDNLLAALGIQLGNATVWVTGARCGVPVLV